MGVEGISGASCRSGIGDISRGYEATGPNWYWLGGGGGGESGTGGIGLTAVVARLRFLRRGFIWNGGS